MSVSTTVTFARGIALVLFVFTAHPAAAQDELVEQARAAGASARGRGLTVEVVGGERVEAAAGRPLNVAFRIRNETGDEHVVVGRSLLPEGWRRLIPGVPVRIPSDSAETVILSASVPVSAVAGDYAASFTAYAKADTSVTGAANVRVTVSMRRGLDLIIEEAPEFVPAGETATLRARVTNTGNVDTVVKLTLSGTEESREHLSMLRLAAGESAAVPLSFTASRSRTGVFTVEAVLEEAPSVRVRRNVTVPIVVRGESRSGYHELPAEVQIRLPADGLSPRPQILLSGSGPLFDAGEERVDVFIRTPSQRSVGIYGAADTYRASYHSERVDVLLGDHVYRLSPLTTSGGSFFGAQTDVHFGSTSVGALINRSRWQFFDQGQQAAYVSYGEATSGQASLQLLNRTGIYAGQVATLRSLWHYVPLLRIDAEAGVGRRDSENGSARSVRIGGESERIDYLLQHEHADIEFPSSERGRDVNTARLSWKPIEGVQIYGHYLRSASEYPYLDEASSSLRSSRLRIGSRYRVSTGEMRFRVSAGVERAGQKSEYPDDVFRSTAQSILTEAGLGYRVFGLHTTAEFGTVDEDGIGRPRSFREYTVQTSIQPSANQGYNVFLHAFRGARMYSSADYRNVTINFTGYYRPASRTTLRIRSSAGLSQIAHWDRGFLVQADVEHAFNNGHSVAISAFGQKFFGAQLDRALFLLSYTLPFELPTTRSRVDGRLTGRVVHTDRNAGMANVRVLLGDRIALTDDAGAFEFAGLEPGAYRLSLHRADVGLDLVPVRSLPTEVTLRAGERREMRLDVTRGASIAGRVELQAFASNGHLMADTTLVSKGGLRNVVLDLVRDSLHHQQVTNQFGEFRFTGLSPGTWTLRVFSKSVPADHHAKPQATTFTLAPGEEASTAVYVAPRLRRVRFMQPEENE